MTAGTVDIHATTVAIGARAVMLMGPSGAGKSDLALRLIDRGAELVADDYTRLTRTGDVLHAAPPPTIAGRMEVRGVGIVALDHRHGVAVSLAVRLTGDVPRMPDAMTCEIAGVALPVVTLDPYHASAAIKVELALDRFGG